jgi:hypothetical protein
MPAPQKKPNRTATRKPATRVAAGGAILQRAMTTVFPMPERPKDTLAQVRYDTETEGVLRGFAAALDAVGYDYGKEKVDV